MSFPIANCASHPNCTSCLGNGNPLCGWCVVENKCSKISECQNSDNNTRWIRAAGTRTDQCLSISITPEQYVVDNPMSVSNFWYRLHGVVVNCYVLMWFDLLVCSIGMQIAKVMSRYYGHLQSEGDNFKASSWEFGNFIEISCTLRTLNPTLHYIIILLCQASSW